MSVSGCDLTICICAYNAEKYIAETLESLKQQTCKNFKLLIVNDCSTDNTVAVAKRYADSGWTDFEIISLPKNYGTAYARNFALHHATTDYMMFFDSDDVASPEMVDMMYGKIVRDKELIAVGCFCDYMSSSGRKLSGGIYWSLNDKEDFLRIAKSGKMFFMTPPTIFVREYAIKVGGYRQKDWFPSSKYGRYEDLSEDLDLWSRLSDFYVEHKWMVVVRKTLYHYRKTRSSLSTGFAKSRMMGQKMMYIKHNLLRRRASLPEDTFDKFWRELSCLKKLNFERKNIGSYLYRMACFHWVENKFFSAFLLLFAGAIWSPEYPLRKLKCNFFRHEK